MLLGLNTMTRHLNRRLFRRALTRFPKAYLLRLATTVIRTNYLHPDDALIQIPPAPSRDILPLSTLRGHSLALQPQGEKLAYKPRLAIGREKTLCSILHVLPVDLHWCHRERIHWRAEKSLKPTT